ncbi:MAG: glycosyltransferase family A protein, partial [Candidatus Uhrbacteria bacterium]
MNPLISIIIPTYNVAKFLPECLDSVFGQTLQDFEVIVVNDGSTDDTLEVLEAYQDRIKLIDQENQGRNPARMRGFQEASGQLLLFLDSDIKMQPDMLENLHQALENQPEASFAYGQFRFDGKFFHNFEFDPELLKKMNYIHTSALVRREHFPGFDPAIKKFQDWDVWLSMMANGYQGTFVPKLIFEAQVDSKEALSKWLPAFAYKIPWQYVGWKPKRIRDYEEAKRIIKEK